MQVKAQLNNLRISPRKVRLVTDLIRGLDVVKAKSQLQFLIKRSSKPILKLLNSAIANAKHNFKLSDESNLYISEIIVNGGKMLKRTMPRAMGRAYQIKKRTSKILMVLDERVKSYVQKEENTEAVKIVKKKETVKKVIKKVVKKEEKTEKKSTKKVINKKG